MNRVHVTADLEFEINQEIDKCEEMIVECPIPPNKINLENRIKALRWVLKKAYEID